VMHTNFRRLTGCRSAEPGTVGARRAPRGG
jgi:hypothetical protein